MDIHDLFYYTQPRWQRDLMPCPFCGESEGLMFGERCVDWMGKDGKTLEMRSTYVQCGKCHARSGEVLLDDQAEDPFEAVMEVRRKAAEEWNKRANYKLSCKNLEEALWLIMEAMYKSGISVEKAAGIMQRFFAVVVEDERMKAANQKRAPEDGLEDITGEEIK